MRSIDIMSKILELEEFYGVNIKDQQKRKLLTNSKKQPEIAKELMIPLGIYQEYKSLTKLIPEIQELVDDSIPLRLASHHVSKLSKKEQYAFFEKYSQTSFMKTKNKDMGEYIDKLKSEMRGTVYLEPKLEIDKTIIERVIHEKTDKDRLRSVWGNMKQRCYNVKSKAYPYYGGRGITICNEWLNDFKEFESWAMRNWYSEGYTIDRIDVNGNYCPKNCQWANWEEQANNKTNTQYCTIDGITHSVADWRRIIGISYETVHDRIERGWDMKTALCTRLYDECRIP